MKLYHGSNMDISVPDLSKSKPYKDFGQGFYLSADKNQATEMAKQKTVLMRFGTPCVSVFEFNESLMLSSELKVKIFNEIALNGHNSF